MFERNLGVKIFMFVCFGFLAVEFFAIGFFLDRLCLELGNYASPLDCFNSGLLYVMMADFVVKFLLKSNQSMQIAPYLTLPIKRNGLFNFLQSKEFVSMWNWYMMFLIVPFAFKVIPVEYSFFHVFVFLICFYLLCIANSLLVALTKAWVKTGIWKLFFPAVIIAGILVAAFKFNFSFGDYTQQFGSWLMGTNPIAWVVFIGIFIFLWCANRWLMRSILYKEMQGEKVRDSVSFSNMSFLDRFGEIGEFINLELKLIFRNKRLKNQLFTFVAVLVIFGVQLVSNRMVLENFFMSLFWIGFMVGGFGLIFSQFLFMAESSYFDGLITRNHSFLSLMKAKYYSYVVISFLVYLLLLAFIWYNKMMSVLLITSAFFYYIGVVYCCVFQNGVYNKTFLDLSDSGFMNWKTSTTSQMIITMVAMFVPIGLVVIVKSLTSEEIACYFMLTTGVLFVLGSNIWLKWTCNRMMKRRYIIMEGFRN
ncbi:hypothetical protein FACS1894155_02620 [Bacteroidia bacterium]|nr:hypothetical protein FACS1894155_02620 [Bacteroidia bacterium]